MNFFGVFYNSPHGILSKIPCEFLERAVGNYCDGVIFFFSNIYIEKGYKTRFFELLFLVTAWLQKFPKLTTNFDFLYKIEKPLSNNSSLII